MLHLEKAGRGVPVVILGGAPCTLDHLRPLAARLANRHLVALVHLPGYGESPPLHPYELEKSHQLVEQSLLSAGIRSAHLIGMSGGAYRAFALAIRGDVRAHSVVTLGALTHLREDEAAGLRTYAAMIRDGVDTAAILEERMLSPAGRQNAAWVADVRAWATACSAETLAGELDAFAAAPDLRPALARLDLPMLLRVGTLDVATPPHHSEELAGMAHRAALQLVEGVGHALLCEDFEGTASAIEAHLAVAPL